MSQSGSSRAANVDSLPQTQVAALGIDLGGTKVSAAVVCQGKLLGEPVQVFTPGAPDKIIDTISNLIASFQNETILAGVGIATAGIVRGDTGAIIGSTGNLPGWTGTPLKKIIELKTKLPVEVENDANAAAYGEGQARSLQSKKCVVLVTIGTGIGAGILIDGKVFHGAHWGAGECGHIRVSLDSKRLCTCGLFDCWEAFGSGIGMITTARELLAQFGSKQSSLALEPSKISTRLITSQAHKGDVIAQQTISLWHQHLAAGLTTLAHTLDPDCFILSGGLSQVIDYQLLKKLVKERCLLPTSEKLEIFQSLLGNQAGIIGAAELLLDRLSETKKQQATRQ